MDNISLSSCNILDEYDEFEMDQMLHTMIKNALNAKHTEVAIQYYNKIIPMIKKNKYFSYNKKTKVIKKFTNDIAINIKKIVSQPNLLNH